MLLTALLLSAHATSTGGAGDAALEPSCPAPALIGSIPADGAADVGLGAPVTVVVDGGQCGERITFLLEDSLGVVAEGDFDDDLWVGSGRHLRVDVPLVAATAYTLTVIPEYNGEQTELTFTTGDEAYVAPPLDELTLTTEVLDVFDVGGGRLDVLVDATIEAPQGALVHLSTDPSFTSRLFVSDASAITETVQIITDTGEACVHARLEDAEGNQGDWFAACEAVEAPVDDGDDDDDDDEPYKPSRCQAAPAPLSGMLALAGLLGLARRRTLR